jgi:hypothetical protein
MDALPWHLQIAVYRGIGRDVLRSLGVRPGKLAVPEALREALGRSIGLRRGTDAWIPIAGTAKKIRITMICRGHSDVAVFGQQCLLECHQVGLVKEPGKLESQSHLTYLRAMQHAITILSRQQHEPAHTHT